MLFLVFITLDPSPVTSLLMYGCSDMTSGAYVIILKEWDEEVVEHQREIVES
jgi:hypothetical protein